MCLNAKKFSFRGMSNILFINYTRKRDKTEKHMEMLFALKKYIKYVN